MGELVFIVGVILVFEFYIIKKMGDNCVKKMASRIDLNILENDFVRLRFTDTIYWFEKRSIVYRFKYIFYTMIGIILSSTIPLITLWEGGVFGLENKFLIGFMSTLNSIISGYLYLREPRAKWYEYRKNAESLKRLLSLKIINDVDEKKLLEELENVLKSENETWYSSKDRHKIEKNTRETIKK